MTMKWYKTATAIVIGIFGGLILIPFFKHRYQIIRLRKKVRKERKNKAFLDTFRYGM